MKKEIRILMVEDSTADAVLMDRELRKGGLAFQATRIETKEDFLCQLHQNRPDLILLDHGLPTFDGFTALKLARERVPDVPVIFVTGSLGEETILRTLKQGADDYVLKHHLPDLVPAVHRALMHAEERRRRCKAEEELQARVRQQEMVAKLGLRALATCDVDALMREAVSHLAATLKVEFCQILELQPDTSDWKMRAGVGWNPEWIGEGILHAQPGSLADFTLKSPEPVLFNDLPRETRFCESPFLVDHGIVSGMNVLLRRADKPYAILGVYSSHPRAFKEHDIHCVQAVANILATALERRQAEARMEQFNAELEQRVKQRTEQLEVANRELEAFSYSVSHDLRAPLRHMDGFVEILRCSVPEDQLNEQTQRSLRAISEAARRMGRLIEDLLAFSRMARAEMNATPVNLAAAIEKVRTELQCDCAGRHVSWEIQTLPTVNGDPEMLRLVFTNLLANALKYTRPRENARIQIGVQPADQETILFVRDNGVGFDPQYAHKLFGVFQRLHSTKEFDGTGIGLAIVRRIVMRHGGRVWAEGALGEGATFFFSLPHLVVS
jgi:signal transduction histidine kinase/DNA-binding NarL/FixJ family response regulator